MLTKQNVSMKNETIIGLRTTRAAVQDSSGVQDVAITLDMIKFVRKSHHFYTEHFRQEAAKKNTKEGEKAKAEAQKKKCEEKKAEERVLDEKLQKLKMEERGAHDAMGEAMSYIDESGKKIHDGLKAGNMMEDEAGNKVIEVGRKKQSEAQGTLEDISKEKDLVQNQFFKKSGSKKNKKFKSMYKLTILLSRLSML